MLGSEWVVVVQGLIVDFKTKKILMAHRPPGKKKPLMWEYPGGKVEKGGSLPVALARELKEELDIDVVVGHRLAKSVFMWKENVELYLFAIDSWTGDPKPLVATELAWVDHTEAIDDRPMLPGAFAVYREVDAYIRSLP